MDPLSVVADEVALEGLDGITLTSLWIRLENREPKFPLKLDDCTKGLLWKSVACNEDLSFYELPSEREDVVLFDRFKDIDSESTIHLSDSFTGTDKDIYPVHIISENKDGILGSCAFFKERTDITKHVRSKDLALLLTLEEAMERYGRKLVVVASQMTRFRALIGSESDPDIKLSDNSYCVLEKVGRARWQGELQRDLHGSCFKVDARKFHYLRKSLVKHELVTLQSYVKRLPSGLQQYSILLLLKRFHMNRRTLYDMLMEFVSSFLQQAPGQSSTVMHLRDQMNVDERIFKRILKYMRIAKLVQIFQYPLEDLDPSAGPCTHRNGSKVQVRCLRLLKPYVKKGLTEAEDDDDEDEEVDRSRSLPSEGRIIEKDHLSQAYHIVLSCGTKGISQRGLGVKLNIGKLDSRMVCRKLEGDGVIKGFMEDEGRQRTTKFISHRCVGVSDQLQLFAKEREKNKLFYSSAPSTPNAKETSSVTPRGGGKAPAKSKRARRGKQEEKEDEGQAGDESKGDDRSKGKGHKAGRGRSGGGRKKDQENKLTTEDTEPEAAVAPPPGEGEAASCNKSVTPEPDSISAPDQAPVDEEEQSSSPCASSVTQTEVSKATDNASTKDAAVINCNVVSQLEAPHHLERSHETYRLLRRKNLIVEAVNNLRIIEGLFPLQKMINEQEKQEGVSTKCCKKTILRLVQSLSRQGLLKIYTTTVIQDGVTKKVDMIVHPSIQPNDDIVNQVIEQARFKMSNSYVTARMQHAEQKAREQEKGPGETSSPKGQKCKAERRRAALKEDDFTPVPVRGLSKTLGFQPKMHRLRAVHQFLWYIIYGHPLLQTSATQPDAKRDLKETENSANSETQPSDGAAADTAQRESADNGKTDLHVMSDDEGEEQKDDATRSHSSCDAKVYVDEDSWKRFVPPVYVQKDYARGWALVGDVLLCLPLSVFVQVIQVNYKVDRLEEYLNDPVKQHYLIRMLPAPTKRQLLYKRKYVIVFYENLQRLTYMGLLQFGPVEKFQDRDQVFVYLKRNTTIVDTTNAEPHYWLISESPDKPFQRRHYTLNTNSDVENYWFDLMCVCLNTPLGVIRSKRRSTEDDVAPSFVRERNVFTGLAYLLKGSSEPRDDGWIPGDGKGAGGLDSEFFAHLKRNWLWTNHLLSITASSPSVESQATKTRLKSLLSRSALTIALAGGTAKPHYVTTKRPLLAVNVELGIEPASRNQQVVGGKRQKRKRTKKDAPVKVPKKRKKAEPKKRTPAHDEADHKALKMMTRQRVYWSVQEDSLMMLCCVATHLLNHKLKRPFVPHCVVRDLLHSEFEVSLDKTSVSVGRRCRYILKNPQTLLNYRICVAEVCQDKALMKVLEEKKPSDPDNPENCAKAFSEYIRLLRQKFSSIMNSGDVILPDSKQELFSRFKVAAIDCGNYISCKDKLSSIEDIHAIVLHNLIQSTLVMNNSQMKSSRSFQTFHMYSKYDQELLCQVFILWRKRGLVNRRRVTQPFGPKKSRALPILPMSYQLSQSYYKCFSWRFPNSLCTDAFCFLKTLIDNPTGDSRPATTFYHEPETRSVSGEDGYERKATSKRREKQSARKEDVGPVNEPEPRSQRTDINQVSEEAKVMEAAVNSEKTEIDHEQKAQDGSHEGPSSREQAGGPQLVTSNKARKASDDLADMSDMLQFSLDSVGGACVVSLSLMSLGLLSVHMSIPKQMVVVDTNLVDNDVVKSMTVLDEDDDDDEDGDEGEGKKRLQVKGHQASHTKYLMMRGYCTPGIVQVRNLNTNDNIVVETCRMRLQLRESPAHHVFREENLSPLDLTNCGPSLLPSSLTTSFHSSSSVEECDRLLMEQRRYARHDVEACALLRRSLHEAGQNGVDVRDLQQAHEDLQQLQPGRTRILQQYMKDLEEMSQVVRVGSLGARWVLTQHAKPWLLTVNTKQWSHTRLTSSRLSYMTKQHNVPFMRKKCIRQRSWETAEPAAKRQNVDGEDDTVVEDGAPVSSETMKGQSEENPKGRTDAGGEKPSNLEEEAGKTTKPEEEAESLISEDEKTEQRDGEDNRDEDRDDEPCSPPSGSPEHENVSFVSRPWRMVDGKLNSQVCKGMLEAVLYHIMSRPGLTQQALVEHYKDLLQPVAVLDLVQALIDLDCVTKKTLVKGRRPSLFSRPAPPAGNQAKEALEEPAAVFYEPTLSCCLRLCRVLPNERHWNSCTP